LDLHYVEERSILRITHCWTSACHNQLCFSYW